MRNRVSSTHVIAILLFAAACVLGAWSQTRNKTQQEVPRARFNDATPLGGKGLRLMLERLGYTVKREDGVLQRVPRDAKVWILVDPQTGFTKREANDLLAWVKNGGTLIWATASLIRQNNFGAPTPSQLSGNTGAQQLASTLRVAPGTSGNAMAATDEPLPPLSKLQIEGANIYGSGVKSASGSSDGVVINGSYLEIAGSPVDIQIARLDYGQGRVFVAPDALLFTNYALSKPDNAVLVTNLVRAHVASGTVYFDERNHGEDLQAKVEPNLLYYLWRPPLRYALLQLLVAALLLWAYFGRRFGAPVPLPDAGPVTRASQFAAAMGGLFRKANRPRAAALITGEYFRRELTRRLGLSITDPDEMIAIRAAEATGYSSRVLDRLLLQAKAPDDDEERALADAALMEKILRSFDRR